MVAIGEMPTLDEARAYFIERISRFEMTGLFLHATPPPTWDALGLTGPVLKKLGYTKAGACGRPTNDDYDKRSRKKGGVPVPDVVAQMDANTWYTHEWMTARGLTKRQLEKQRRAAGRRKFFSFEPDTTLPKRGLGGCHPWKYIQIQ